MDNSTVVRKVEECKEKLDKIESEEEQVEIERNDLEIEKSQLEDKLKKIDKRLEENKERGEKLKKNKLDYIEYDVNRNMRESIIKVYEENKVSAVKVQKLRDKNNKIETSEVMFDDYMFFLESALKIKEKSNVSVSSKNNKNMEIGKRIGGIFTLIRQNYFERDDKE